MELLLVFGTLAVGLGLGTVAVAGGRSFAAGRTDGSTIEAILEDSTDIHGAELHEPFVERLLGPAFVTLERAVRTVTPAWWIERLKRNTALAGPGWVLEEALGIKALCMLVGGVILLAAAAAAQTGTPGVIVWGTFGALVGFVIPDVWIARRAAARQDEIRRTLPEALDLLAIAVQAGMGLEQAIELVARRLPGALGAEFHRMLQEVQLGSSRREALAHLRERTEVTELGTFALSLAQADALGSPLGEVLRVQANQMRMMRRQTARETAAKVPVKLLFPLLLCIFPALGIVVVGPAAIVIIKAFAH